MVRFKVVHASRLLLAAAVVVLLALLIRVELLMLVVRMLMETGEQKLVELPLVVN